MKTQTFGIEIEMTGLTRQKAAETVKTCFENASIGYEGGGYDTRYIFTEDGRKWKIVRDSSISPECSDRYIDRDECRVEFVSPICTYSDIEKIQEIVRALRAAGAKVNSSCGLHVHIGADGHTANSLINITKTMANIEPLLFKALAIPEARTDRWCKPVDKDFLDRITNSRRKVITVDGIKSIWYDGYDRSYQHYDSSRYHALNLHSIWQKATAEHLGTIEFRLFNSTLHAGEVKTAIQLAYAISHFAKTQKRVKLGYRPGSDQSENTLMNRWIALLGLNGDEFKTARFHLRKGMKKALAAA